MVYTGQVGDGGLVGVQNVHRMGLTRPAQERTSRIDADCPSTVGEVLNDHGC